MNIKWLLYIKERIRSWFMGRPRKTQGETLSFKEQQAEISAAIEEVNGNQVVMETSKKEEPVYNRVGLGIYVNPETGLKHLIEIPFNDKLEVGKPKVVSEGDGRDIISERFRIRASEIL